ncbi:zf-HC2 domain-containing protein [Corynebacterium macclintockiae]|uniref:zf-HC2 domain-containing protein n=1 Tax=Corynebacterium macclintockiae TaxID=2913501 RepID=UPI003EC0CCEF
MDCQEVRTSMSARLDGESAALSDDLVDAHLAGCEDCQRWYATITALGRNLNLAAAPSNGEQMRSAEDSDDRKAALVEQVLAQADQDPQINVGLRRRQLSFVLGRAALVAVAVLYVLWGVSLLFGVPIEDDATSSQLHLVSDAAAMRFALAGGLLWAAWRPKVASAILPIYLAIWAFGVGFATREIVLGLISEAGDLSTLWLLLVHLAAVLALVVVWAGRQNVFMPLRQSLRALMAQPINFSPSDARRNSTYAVGEPRPRDWE